MSYGQFGGFPQFQITFAGMTWTGGMPAGVSTITAIDSNFNGEEFITYAQGAFLRVMEAREAERLEDVRPVLSQSMFQTFQSTKGKVPKIDHIEHATIYDARRDAWWDTVTVRIPPKTTAKNKIDLDEDWTFQRPAVTGQQQLAAECPSCGAPTSLDENGACRYCRVSGAGARGGWKLVRALPPPAAPKVSSGRSWLAFWVIFMILMTVVLPIGIFAIIWKTTDDVSGSFGFGSSGNSPLVTSQSASKEAVTPTPKPIPTVAPTGNLSGTTVFTGGFNGNLEGDVVLSGAMTGPCTSRAPATSGLVFTTGGTGDDGEQVNVTVTMNLPPAVRGPGDFSLPDAKLDIVTSFTGHYADGSGQDSAQTWVVGASTTATFKIDASGGGSLSVAGLEPSAPFPPNNSLSKPLQLNLTFTCG
jgi:hypothetical protein